MLISLLGRWDSSRNQIFIDLLDEHDPELGQGVRTLPRAPRRQRSPLQHRLSRSVFLPITYRMYKSGPEKNDWKSWLLPLLAHLSLCLGKKHFFVTRILYWMWLRGLAKKQISIEMCIVILSQKVKYNSRKSCCLSQTSNTQQ